MTAVDVLERQAGTAAGIPECSAMIPVTFQAGGLPVLMRCPNPPVVQVEGRCPHGHVREGWLCEGCAAVLKNSGCRACLEDERFPHGCPLTVTVRECGHGQA